MFSARFELTRRRRTQSDYEFIPQTSFLLYRTSFLENNVRSCLAANVVADFEISNFNLYKFDFSIYLWYIFCNVMKQIKGAAKYEITV